MADLPKLSTNYGTNSYNSVEGHAYSGEQGLRQQHTTSLPSFASFQEHANRTDDPDEVEIAPMSSRLSCYLCTKLKPLLREAAIAVAELDENVQSYCNKSATRVCLAHCLAVVSFPGQTIDIALDRHSTFLGTIPFLQYNGFLKGSLG